MQRRVSYAQNAEDIRVWRAFRAIGHEGPGLTYIDVGANEPRELSITASLSDMGWSGLLIEADPQLAAELRVHRPSDTVVECAASDVAGELTFFAVPGTGLGTTDDAEAQAARARGFAVESVVVQTELLDEILERHGVSAIHFMSIDVEGAEAAVLRGLSLDTHRPWVLCIEAVYPGTTLPSHDEWEPMVLDHGYEMVTFDGVNRWYVSQEHADLAEALAIPFNAIDVGEDGWVTATEERLQERAARATARSAWQRELTLNDLATEVPASEYLRQIEELRASVIRAEGSRAFALASKGSTFAKRVIGRVKATALRMPSPVSAALVRRRHLRHVRAEMPGLTPASFLAGDTPGQPSWIVPSGLPATPNVPVTELTEADARSLTEWLAGGPWDDDAMLERRIDNHGDELGRTVRAIRERLALFDATRVSGQAPGGRVLFDARCLQTAEFGNRGIGRFAKAALDGVRNAVGDERVVLLVDQGLEPLPLDMTGACPTTTRVSDVALFSMFIQPSPMTFALAPYLPVLSSSVHKVAIIYDYIPLHHQSTYLNNVAAHSEYAVCLDALRRYDEFLCISHLVAAETKQLGIAKQGSSVKVAWPASVLPDGAGIEGTSGDGPIVLMTGDDARKNTFGGLAGIGVATSGESSRDVVVIGMAGQGTRVHHWSIAAAMRPGEAKTPDRVPDEALRNLLGDASAVVVPSFDEGLSLPVIEAVLAGATVIASDIPAHRELIGKGTFLADPRDPAAFARALKHHRGRNATHRRQMARLRRHQHEILEEAVATSARLHVAHPLQPLPASAVHVRGASLSVGVAGPWSPQRSGVADFTTTTTIELAKLADVTAYVTASADVAASLPSDVRMQHAPVDALLAAGHHHHDALITVMGNSHYHLPFIDVVNAFEPIVVTHDTRLVELYLALRGQGRTEQLMLRGTGRRSLQPPLNEQIDDMRLLENMGFWEVARRAQMFIAHTPSAAPRITAETGVPVRLLPFANQRVPDTDAVTEDMRAQARKRLGFDEARYAGTVHLASFGYLDIRTKLSDAVLESAAWLQQWGHSVSLHFVGAATPPVEEMLLSRASDLGLKNVTITGFVSETTFRDYLMAIDLGVQLRISPLLGVSGPLSDMAAFGTPAVASGGLARDVDAPAFIERLPDEVSPLIVAESIERQLASPVPFAERESARREYLERMSPARYAELLLPLLEEASTSR